MPSVTPNLWIAAMVSPPPAIENAFDAGDRARDRLGALGELVDLEHADRAVPDDGSRLLEQAGERGRALRADVENHVVRRDAAHVRHGLARARRHLARDHDVLGQRHVGRRHDLLRLVDQARFGQRLADREALRQQEGVQDAAADDQPVHLLRQRGEQRQLGGDLRAGDDRDQRARRIARAPCRARPAPRPSAGRRRRSWRSAPRRASSPRRGARCRRRR